MFQTLKNAFKVKEIRVKIWMTLVFILIYRLGCYIPVPGIGGELISSSELSKVSYLGIMSMMTGGSLANGTWLAMGISPYINASIIIQLLTVAIPALERISKTGEEGQKKINNMTRIGALLLAVIQSVGILISFNTSIKEGTDTAVPFRSLRQSGMACVRSRSCHLRFRRVSNRLDRRKNYGIRRIKRYFPSYLRRYPFHRGSVLHFYGRQHLR